MLEKYKKKLDKVFSFSTCVRRGFSLDKAEIILSEFRSVCPNDNERWYGELALYYAKLAADFAVTLGDMDDDFYDILVSTYEDATVAASNDETLYNLWRSDLKNIINQMYSIREDVAFDLEDYYIDIPWRNDK